MDPLDPRDLWDAAYATGLYGDRLAPLLTDAAARLGHLTPADRYSLLRGYRAGCAERERELNEWLDSLPTREEVAAAAAAAGLDEVPF